jgi:hypothetical protein
MAANKPRDPTTEETMVVVLSFLFLFPFFSPSLLAAETLKQN